MRTIVGKLLTSSIIRSVGARVEVLRHERDIRGYLESYAEKFGHSVQVDPRALPHYRFHLVRGRGNRLLGGFMVNANKAFSRTLSLAPSQVATHPALGGQLAELCMLFKGDRVSKLESGALLLLGVRSALALAPTILCFAAEWQTFDIYQRYLPHLAFEGFSSKLDCRLWVVYGGREEFYRNVLTAAPADVIMRVFQKRTYRATAGSLIPLDPDNPPGIPNSNRSLA